MFTDWQMAWFRIRRAPGILWFLVITLGTSLGIAVACLAVFLDYATDPLPGKSDRVFAVQLDSWTTEAPWLESDTGRPPDRVTYVDAMNLMQAGRVPGEFAAMYAASALLRSGTRDTSTPKVAGLRVTTRSFFDLFAAPFQFGQAWSSEAGKGARVAVLSHRTNQELFGGADSRGKIILLDDRPFQVVGVLENWDLVPKFYDLGAKGVGPPDDVFIPFETGIALEIQTTGDYGCWGKQTNSAFGAWLQSECVWIQLWLELGSPAAQPALTAIDAYVDEQKALGRFPRPRNNRLTDVSGWIALNNGVPSDVVAMLVVSMILFTLCASNAITMWLAKWESRDRELGVHQALGASLWRLTHQSAAEFLGIMAIACLGATVTALLILRQQSSLGIEEPVPAAALMWALTAGTVVAILLSMCIAGGVGWIKLRSRPIAQALRSN